MFQYESKKIAHLNFYVPIGVPTSGSFELQDSNGATIVSASTASTGSVNVAVQGTQYSETLACTQTGSIDVGQYYWLSTSANGRGYSEQVIDVSSGSVRLANKLRFALPSGSLMRSHNLYYDHTESAVRRNCTIIWRYVVNSTEYAEFATVDFVTKPFKISVSETDIERVCALFGIESGETSAYMKYTEQAIFDVFCWLNGQQIKPDSIVAKDLLKNAVIYRVLQFRNFSNIELSEKYEKLYNDSLATFLTSKAWIVEPVEVSSTLTDDIVKATIPPKYALIG